MNRKNVIATAVPVGLMAAVLVGLLLAGNGHVAQPQTTASDLRGHSSQAAESPRWPEVPKATPEGRGASVTPQGADSSSGSKPVLKVYVCPPGTLQATALRLQTEFGAHPHVRIVPDQRTSQLLVMAPPQLQAQIAERVPQDRAPGQAAPASESPAQPSPAGALAILPESRREIQLWEKTGQEFESSLLRLFANRLSPVTSPAPDVSTYDLALLNGQVLRLSIDRRSNRVRVEGSGATLESAVRIVHAMDSGQQSPQRSMSLVSVTAARPADIRRIAEALRAGSGRQGIAVQPDRMTVAMRFQQPDEAAPGGAAQGPAAPGEAAEGVPGEGEAGEGEEGGMIGPVDIQVLEGMGAVIISGHARDVERVSRLLKELQEISAVTVPVIRVLHLEHVNCSAMAELLNQIYEDVFALRQASVSITALVKPNALLLIGQEDNVKMVIGLAQRLDRPVAPETQFQVFPLRHAGAEDAQAMLQEFFDEQADEDGGLGARVQMTHDFRSNALIVRASPRDMVEVAAMIRQIDVTESPAFNEVKVFRLYNSMAEELAMILQDAITGQMYGQRARLGVGVGAAPGMREDFEHKSIRLQFLTVGPDGQDLLMKSGILMDVQITANARANTLVVTASAESMPLIAALIKELDGLPAAVAAVKVFTLTNGDASTVASMLETLFVQQVAAGQPTVRTGAGEGESTLVPMRFAVDERTNSIIVAGSQGDLIVVEALLDRLDESTFRERKTTVYRLKNAEAATVAQAVTDFLSNVLDVEQTIPGLSPQEQVEREVIMVAEEVSNVLIVSATDRFYDQVNELIEEIDKREPMVIIQVLIAEVALRDEEEFGVELGLQDPIFFNRSVNGLPGFLFNTTDELGNNTTVPGSNIVGSQGISNLGLGRFNPQVGFGGMVLSASSEFVSVMIRALELQGRVEILGRPQIMALDNREARVSVGQEVPLVTDTRFGEIGTSQITSWSYEPVGLGLLVTPRISPDGLVVMIITAEKKSLAEEGILISGTEQPIINSIVAETVVSAMDGQTVVLGGLITNEKSKVARKVPWLGDLPLLGRLFRYDSSEERRSELLIIMTPHIVDDDEDVEAVKQAETARMHWCLSDVLDLHGEGVLVQQWSDSETQVIYPDTGPGAEGKPIPTAPPVGPEPGPGRSPFIQEPTPAPGHQPPVLGPGPTSRINPPQNRHASAGATGTNPYRPFVGGAVPTGARPYGQAAPGAGLPTGVEPAAYQAPRDGQVQFGVGAPDGWESTYANPIRPRAYPPVQP